MWKNRIHIGICDHFEELLYLGIPSRPHAFFRCCVDAKLAAAVLAVYGSAKRVPCVSTMDAGRAAQMRDALSLS